jgi:hypothetical protein
MADLKDVRLYALSRVQNVAQFVSFSAGDTPRVRFSRVRELELNEDDDIDAVVPQLLDLWGGSANIRSFLPDQEQGNPFYYGLTSVAEIKNVLHELASSGYLTIVNETINVADGGVSGVAHGNVLEFSPEDTPRAVEKPGVVSIRKDWGVSLLAKVYGFSPDLPQQTGIRTEFSIHPKRVGFLHTHTLIWETNEKLNPPSMAPAVHWPNNFSRFIGDKAFGLLMADTVGLPVPKTLVIPRKVAPFQFGRTTSTDEYWLRTCPIEKVPGKFSTTFEWRDPFKLLTEEDPNGDQLASVLVQESVDAVYSGATVAERGVQLVQGVAGKGDRFMLGTVAPDNLPESVVNDVKNTVDRATEVLGTPVQIEWAHDGRRTWIVQISVDRSSASHGVLIAGGPVKGWLSFDPSDGLEKLNQLIQQATLEGKGINVLRPVGQTSHVGDLIRASGLSARYVSS